LNLLIKQTKGTAMNTTFKKMITLLTLMVLSVLVVTGCSEGQTSESAVQEEVTNKAEGRVPYLPKNDVEFNNYNAAQKLYDSPTTIIWCSVMPQASSAPILTVPITGKLTSSSTTFFRPEEFIDRGNYAWQTASARSVDGMFHPNPPQYRYGFTPGGQYIDFFNLPTFCTTKPLDFQKDSVSVKIDSKLNNATEQAEKALAAGDNAKAQRLLEAASNE
jgi:hypothetical protein